jgi:hypothetical protein
MKNRNTQLTAVLFVLTFALAPIVQAAPSPGGGPTRPPANEAPQPDGGPVGLLANERVSANSEASSAYVTSPQEGELPVVMIQSTGNVTRGKTGSFVLHMVPGMIPGTYVNFSVSGTAIPGVDYVRPLSPVYVGPSGYGVILIQTLPDPRGSYIRQSYSVVVTLEAGAGYALGVPSSAQMMIKP